MLGLPFGTAHLQVSEGEGGDKEPNGQRSVALVPGPPAAPKEEELLLRRGQAPTLQEGRVCVRVCVGGHDMREVLVPRVWRWAVAAWGGGVAAWHFHAWASS